MTELLERVTAELQPEPGLVAAGVAAGRRRRRRHLVGTAAATVTVLGLAGTGLTVALSGDGAGGARGVDRRRSHRRGPKAQATRPGRALGPRGHRRPGAATFAALRAATSPSFPGRSRTSRSSIPMERLATRVGLISDSFITGKSVTDPRRRCEEFGSGGQPCEPGRVPGSFEQSRPDRSPGRRRRDERLLTVYFAEGWDVP